MPAATDSAQVLVGTGDLYFGITAGWTIAGGFRDGLMVRINRDFNHLKGFDQSLGIVRSVLTNVTVELETRLAQATNFNLWAALGLTTSPLSVTTSSQSLPLGFSFIASPIALKFIGEDDAGDIKTFVFSQTQPDAAIELSFSRDGQILIPFKATVASTTAVGTPTANDRMTVFGYVYPTSVTP